MNNKVSISQEEYSSICQKINKQRKMIADLNNNVDKLTLIIEAEARKIQEQEKANAINGFAFKSDSHAESICVKYDDGTESCIELDGKKISEKEIMNAVFTAILVRYLKDKKKTVNIINELNHFTENVIKQQRKERTDYGR